MTVPPGPLGRILPKLDAVTGPNAHGWHEARCPAHDDRRRSLGIKSGDTGAAILKCQASCATEAIVAALGLTMRDLFPSSNGCDHRGRIVATYDYSDEAGALLFQVARLEPKGFRQRRPDGNGAWSWTVNGVRRVLYRLPELVAADHAAPVFFVEGEKDADALQALGLVATTNAGGAGKWKHEYADTLRSRHVVILPDNDAAGRQHADQVAHALAGVAASVRVLELPGLPPKGDVSYWLAAGGTRAQLEALVATAARDNGAPRPDPERAWVQLSTIEPEAIEWLWPGRVPLAKVTLLEGDPDEGKSCIAVDVAARVTTGGAMPLEQSGRAPAGVVYVSAEDGNGDTTRPRLEAAGGDPSRVAVFLPEALPQLDAAGLQTLEEAIGAAAARLLVLDPLAAFVPERVDTHTDHHVRRALAPLAALAARTGAAVLIIRHLNKSGGQNAKYRGGGSIGILGAARSALLAAPDPDDESRKVLAVIKHNLAEPVPALGYALEGVPGIIPTVRVRWLGTTSHTARQLLAEPVGEDERSATDEALGWLRAELGKGPKAARLVLADARKEGIAERTLQRARARIATSRKDAFSGGWIWSLSNAEDATTPGGWQAGAFGDVGAFGKSEGLNGAEAPALAEGAKNTEGAQDAKDAEREVVDL